MPPTRPNLVSLDRVPALDPDHLSKLEAAHITTVEALVGQLEADPDALRALLDLTPPEVDALTSAAIEVLPPETQQEFAKQRGTRYSYGALNPKRD